MLKIAICDDNKEICIQISDIINNYNKNTLIELKYKVYLTGTDLYQSLASGEKFDLIFLDIELDKTDGITIGKFIRKTLDDQQTQIVYISGLPQYAMELFAVQPLDFLIKPITQSYIFEKINMTLKLIRNKNNFFIYQVGTTQMKIPITEIIYFESIGRQIKIHHKNGTEMFYSKLDKIEASLSNYSFLRIHKSYLVYFPCIRGINQRYIILPDGTKLSISRSQQKEVTEKLIKINTEGIISWN